jgi:hypothetical protein
MHQARFDTNSYSWKVTTLLEQNLTSLADLRSRQYGSNSTEVFDLMENAIKLAKGASMLHVHEILIFFNNKDAAIYSERIAELYFLHGRNRFAHAYLLEALEMWNAMAVMIKVRHLKERYPGILGDVVLTEAKLTQSSIELSYASNASYSTGFSSTSSPHASIVSTSSSSSGSERGKVPSKSLY